MTSRPWPGRAFVAEELAGLQVREPYNPYLSCIIMYGRSKKA